MELVRLGAGQWEVLAICTGDQDELVSVLEDPDVEASGSSARLLRMFVRYIPDHGAPRNKQKFRRIEGGSDQIYEAKDVSGGLRVFCFRDERRYVITHAKMKPPEKRLLVEDKRAVRLSGEYFAAKAKGQLIITDYEGG